MIHICVCNLFIIVSVNGLLPGQCQAIIWNNDGILLNGPLGTNFSEILIEIYTFSFKKMHLKILSGICWPFCFGYNMLITISAADNLVLTQYLLFKNSCTPTNKMSNCYYYLSHKMHLYTQEMCSPAWLNYIIHLWTLIRAKYHKKDIGHLFSCSFNDLFLGHISLMISPLIFKIGETIVFLFY